jgi:hypothetical protein
MQTRIYRKKYANGSVKSQGHLKKYIKNPGATLIRSIHLCHQKPSPTRETVPLIPGRCWAAFDLYGMAEEVGIVGAEGLQQHQHQQTASESKEGRTEKWNEEEQTKSAKSNKDIKVTYHSGHRKGTELCHEILSASFFRQIGRKFKRRV